ncbi:hypothetical protein J1N35_037498 [Gossypium stocksii]|uniref:Reverse transcriptase domain-containing protein n=1 Tax=Gossypium stocksii TaxID=47602 RepID=A0A9D3ZLR6_9ROSI|nr:hypothetical protein J1N35_037498 [Gossypium stocksii]
MKLHCWNCRGVGNPATVRNLKQLFVANNPNVIFLCETKGNTNRVSSVQQKCKMEGCSVVNMEGKRGGLGMMWKESNKVDIQTYSNNHIDAIIQSENKEAIRFTGYYRNAEPNKGHLSWEMLKSVCKSIKETWIIGGDFNVILDNMEKDGGRRKPLVQIEEFREIMDEFSMVDLKTGNGWFTWTNNREGPGLVKERLDRFLMSANNVNSFPFMETKVLRQSYSDHDAIILDTEGKMPRDNLRDPRLCFKFEDCWAKEKEAKMIIKNAWQRNAQDILDKIETVGKELGGWQFQKFKQMRNQISILQAKINKIIDRKGYNCARNNLKAMRSKLGYLLDKEEKYWAQWSRVSWLKEGDRNTQFFHVRATNRKKKNTIIKLKDMNGNWKENTTDICLAITEYFQHLFKSNLNPNTMLNLDYIERCISGEINDKPLKNFTDSKIMKAFNGMDPRKAPGIDSLTGNFFKENWDVVGKDIIKLCHDILRGDKNVNCVNETIIVLIPKIKEHEDMTNFRPISLCRVVYKIVAKVLANKLKETLPLCISQNQSVFVPGRVIHDNILVVHELVHYFQSARYGPNKGFVIKLDMSKAYDRVK